MSSRRYAAFTALLVLIACDSPAAPRARNLRVPGANRDAGTVLVRGNDVFDAGGASGDGCNGDVVTLEGKAHQAYSEIETGSVAFDTIFVTVHTNFDDLKGYGVPSGTRYHLNNAQMERALVTMGPQFTFDDKAQVSTELISEGSSPNLLMDATVITRIDNTGVTITDVKYSLKCKA